MPYFEFRSILFLACCVPLFFFGGANAQDVAGQTPGAEQLRRFAIPERIDPRDYELDVAMVRVVNLAAGVGALSANIVWEDLVPAVTEQQLDRSQRAWFDPDGVAFGSLAFGTTSDYRQTPAGGHVVLVSAGEDEVATLEAPIALESGAYYTILVSVANGDEQDASTGMGLAVRVVLDPLHAPPAGMAALRFVHAAEGTDAVDVWAWRADKVRALTPPGGPRGMFSPVVEPLDVDDAHLPTLSVSVAPDDSLVGLEGPDGLDVQFYGKATLVSLPPGTYTLTVSRDGFQESVQTFELDATEHIAAPFVLSGDPDEDAARLAGPPPPERITPVWMMPLGDFALVRDIAPGAATAYLSLHAPGYAFEVRKAGSLQVLARVQGDELAPGSSYTVFLVAGSAPDGAVETIFIRDSAVAVDDSLPRGAAAGVP